MYDNKQKRWVANPLPGTGDTEETPYDEYVEADALLEKAARGEYNAEAVYSMECVANKGCAQACFAMGQIFYYGWAVSRSNKLALVWLQKAVYAGCVEAEDLMKEIKKAQRQKRVKILLLCLAIVCVAAVLLSLLGKMGDTNRLELLLPSGSTLERSDSIEETAGLIEELRSEYDTSDMIVGKMKTNRILLVFKDHKIDLRSFEVKVAVVNSETVVLQFQNAEEATRCYEYLCQLPGAAAVEIDSYEVLSASNWNAVTSSNADVSVTSPLLPGQQLPAYHSDASGFDYYSWGVMAMGMDQYAAYLAKTYPDRKATVAVIDTGCEPNEETQSKILSGANMVYGGDGTKDYDEHGTHVSGTIIDCTRGLHVNILPIAVFKQFTDTDGSTSVLAPTSAIIMGLQYAIQQQADVINMSLGGKCDQLKCSEEYYIDEALAKGITVVVAAGNGDAFGSPEDTAVCCPAKVKGACTVGALMSNGQIVSFSNYGDAVDVCAPGYDVLSYVPAPKYFDYLSGTSMASPHVAAFAAMIRLEYNTATTEMVERWIKEHADGCGNNELYYGKGLPKAESFVETTGE